MKEGQVLFTIEPETYQAAVDQKMAQRDAAQAALANADVQLKRAAELLRTNTGTQVTYDQRLSEQLQAKAQVEDAAAQLRDAELQLSYTEIKSPIDGRIGRAAVSPGNIVGPDSGVLATVVSESPIRVLFSVTQRELLDARRDAGRRANGIVVRLRLADGSLYKEKGKIDFIDVTVDAKTDGQMVRAMFDNTDGLLTDGQTVRVIVEGEKVADRGRRAAGRHRPGPDRPLSLRRQRQERGRAEAHQDRRRRATAWSPSPRGSRPASGSSSRASSACGRA